MANPAAAKIVADLEAAIRDMEKALEGTTERELRARPKEGEWTAAEVLAHVTEAIPVWTDRCLRMASQDNPPIGRTPEERARRTAVLPQHANDDIATIRRRFKESASRALADVRKLRDPDLDRTGDRDGNRITARALLDESVVGHLREHVATVLANRKAARSA